MNSRLYGDLAQEWYPLLTPREDYAEEARIYLEIFSGEAPDCRTMLELGSGAGHNAWYLKQKYQMTLTDLSGQMLAISRKINPECEHQEGDMRTLRLGRTFDAVFIHDAICYICRKEDLLQVFQTAAMHLNPGGVVLVCPDFVRETFEPSTDHGGSDSETGSIRYLEWCFDPDPEDTEICVDMVYLMRRGDGLPTVTNDRFSVGLFSQEEWCDALKGAGFSVSTIPDNTFDRILFLGRLLNL